MKVIEVVKNCGIIFIAHQHAVHAEHDIVLPVLSVCPMPVLSPNEWT